MKNFTYFIKLNNEYDGIFDILTERLTELENQNRKEEIAYLEKENKILEDEKDKLKTGYNGIELNSGEELISVIFTNGDDEYQYCFLCKNTDNFKSIEEKFYKKKPEFEKNESTNVFKINDKIIDKSKKLNENNIGDSSIIIFSQ